MLNTALYTAQRPDAGLGLMAPISVFATLLSASSTGHCELFEETGNASVSPLRAQTYSVKLFISRPPGVICQQHSTIQKRKGSGEVVYCNGEVEGKGGMVWRRAASFTRRHVLHYLSHRRTHSHSHGVQISLPSSVKLLSMAG